VSHDNDDIWRTKLTKFGRNLIIDRSADYVKLNTDKANCALGNRNANAGEECLRAARQKSNKNYECKKKSHLRKTFDDSDCLQRFNMVMSS
jgi:hypothetical protein